MIDDAPVVSLPVPGTWRLIKSPGHDTFAFDLVAVGEDLRQTLSCSRLHHALGQASVEHSYSWDKPVFAPTAGTVVRTHYGSADRQQLSLLRDLWIMIISRPVLRPDDLTPFAGNHLIIHGAGAYVFQAHLQAGSLQVKEGQKVQAGQLVGRVGNSGFTLEPHLHLQLFDQIDNLLAASAPPFLIKEYERCIEGRWQRAQNEALHKGELIRSRPQSRKARSASNVA